MDREILFRGQSLNEEEWIYGSLMTWGDGNTTICVPEGETRGTLIRVYPDTVGQYTGLKDRNGTRIFEGDIIKAKQVLCGELLCRGAVEYKNLRWEVPEDDFVVEESLCIEYEVIGNSHDNPELLEGGQNQ